MHTNGGEPRSYRAVFFDLDGTLLPMELDEFLSTYYRSLAGFVGAHGYDVDAFVPALNAGIKAMMEVDDGRANADRFWEAFFARFDAPQEEMRPLVERFYRDEFGRIGEGVEPDGHMVEAVSALAEKGYPLVLATMPLFPRVAVEWRLRWAGVDPSLFSRVTTFENSASTKPKLAYFAENLAACGLRGEEVLMVGNNTVEDLAIRGLGADAYLVTDHLLDPARLDLATVKHGSTADFSAWAKALPICADPARDIEGGLVAARRAQAVVDRDASAEAIAAQAHAQRAARAENARIAHRTQETPEGKAAGLSYAGVFEDGAEPSDAALAGAEGSAREGGR